MQNEVCNGRDDDCNGEIDPKKQRQRFYRDYASGQWSMSELCDRYRISRPTGYKWIDRLETEGLKAVDDRSRELHWRPLARDAGSNWRFS